MRRSLTALVLLLMLCAPAFGLSDAEYRRLKRTNSAFRRADNELTEVWNGLKKSLSSKVFAELQKDQREWIRKGREDEAKRYINEGYSRAEAYTMATSERAKNLPRLADELNGNVGASRRSGPLSPAKKPEPKQKPKPEPEPEPEPDLPDDNDKGEIEEERFRNTEPGNPEGNYSSKNGFMTVIITDKSSMEAAVTITINSPKQVTWSSESWLDDDTLVLYDKTYSDCQVTMTFEGNKVKVETSDTESWNDILGENVRLDGIYTRN